MPDAAASAAVSALSAHVEALEKMVADYASKLYQPHSTVSETIAMPGPTDTQMPEEWDSDQADGTPNFNTFRCGRV